MITYSSVDKDVYRQFAADIRNVAEAQTKMIASIDLQRLPSPMKDELPYRQFLLSQEPMYMPASDDPQKREDFFQELHEMVMGVPSRLEDHRDNREVFKLVKFAAKIGYLVNADDEQIIAQLGKAGGLNGNP